MPSCAGCARAPTSLARACEPVARETLLLLPGMMCDAQLFGHQIDALGGRYDIVVPPLAAPSIEAMAEAVLADAPAGPLNVAGLSMGGIVAMAMAAQAPDRIQRLALLDTNHRADAPERFEVRNRQIEEVRAGRLREVIVDEMKPAYLAPDNQEDLALRERIVGMALSVGRDVFVAQSVALRDRADQSGGLRRFRGPALVLCGAEDRLCPPERHREIAALLRDAALRIIPGAGHLSTLETPEAVTAALEAWLSRSPEP